MQNLKPFKLALLQTKVTKDKQTNINTIKNALNQAAQNGVQVCVFGQLCNSPYHQDYMYKFAQDFNDSETINVIKQVCNKNKMYAIGSIPRREQKNEKVQYFNTAFVVNCKGQLQTQYDKTHLFEIDNPNFVIDKQSQNFTKGNKICVFDTQFCKFGVGICYDIRFAELALLMAQQGARVLIYPGSFNQKTGPVQWEIVLRGRAVDTQCFVVGISTAQAKQFPELFQGYSRSTVVDPFGKVLISLDENPNIGYCEINPEYTEEVRTMIPVRNQKRKDLYHLQTVK